MAQLLLSYKFQSGLRSHMKLHTKQLQHTKSQHINFQSNLTRNMEVPDVLEKGVWKFSIAHWFKLNNYSNCLMCASTAYRQASNTLSMRQRINISPFSVWASISRSSMQELTISPILFDETLWKSLFATRAIEIQKNYR